MAATVARSGPSPRLVGYGSRYAQVAGALVALVGIVVDAAWIFHVHALTSLVPGWPTMKFWTATGLMLLGILLLTHPVTVPGWRRRLRILVALAVLLPAVAFLLEYTTGTVWGIDNIFGLDHSAASELPGRPSAMTAMNLAILALADLAVKSRRAAWAQALGLVSVASAVVALNAYAFEATQLFSIGAFSTMAIHTALSVLVVGTGYMALTIDTGPLSLVAEPGGGGTIVRRILPTALVALFLIAVGAYQLAQHQHISPAFMTACGVTLAMGVVGALVWYQGSALRAAERGRSGAEDALARVRELLEVRDTLTAKLTARESDLRRIIETSPDAFISIDRAGVVTAWNPAAERIFGWGRQEVLGQPLHRFITPDYELWSRDGDFPDKLHRIEAFRGRASDVTAVRKDGSPVRVELTLWPQTEAEPRAFHAFARDITDRRRAEDRLREANADLQEFAAIAAHDLRNPLVTIRLAAEMLRETTSGGLTHEMAVDWIDRILSATSRGQELINDLLEYSSLSSGAAESSRIDLTRVVEDVADQVGLGSTRQLSVEVGTLPIIEGDEPRLRQLFSNLIENAAKYVPADRVAHVSVTARTGRRLVRISVCDNGDGIPEYDKEAIFQVFQRGSQSDGTPGTGVGLAICRKVAERHGGQLYVEDGPDGGACFVLELPRWPGAMTIGPANETAASIRSSHAN